MGVRRRGSPHAADVRGTGDAHWRARRGGARRARLPGPGRRVLRRRALRADHQRPHDGRHRGDGRGRLPVPGRARGEARALHRADHDQCALRRLRVCRSPGPGPRRGREGAPHHRAPARDERAHHRHLHQLPDALPAAPGRARRVGRHGHGDLREFGLRRAHQLRERTGGARRGAHGPHSGVRLSPRPAPQGDVRRAARRAPRRPRRLGRGRQAGRRIAPELLRGARLYRRDDERRLPTS